MSTQHGIFVRIISYMTGYQTFNIYNNLIMYLYISQQRISFSYQNSHHIQLIKGEGSKNHPWWSQKNGLWRRNF